MDTFSIVLEQMKLFIIYIIAGFLMVKSRVWKEETLQPIAQYVLKLGLPLLIFTNIVDGVEKQTLLSSFSVVVITAVYYFCLFFISKGVAKLFHLPHTRADIYQALMMFGNIGFMGIPIITNIFPQNGILYLSVFTIVDQLVLWTVGIKLTTPSGESSFQPKKMINPSTVAIVIAVILVLTGARLPRLLDLGLHKIGATATPMAMLYLGAIFGCVDIRKYLKNIELYGIVLIKMLIIPLLIFFLVGLLPIPEEIRMTIAVVAGMPAMSSLVMMAKAAGADGDYALGGVCITTVLSIGTLPLLCWLLQMLR